MASRRRFIQRSVVGGVAFVSGNMSTLVAAGCQDVDQKGKAKSLPVIISTWNHGIPANAAAFKRLQSGGNALDAVEAGVMVVEGDPSISSVGIGGAPDREGRVTLDACIMAPDGNCGSVCFLENIRHPIAVARKVMEESPHVMLAGEGALQFAVEKGFKEEDLLTPRAREAYEKWLLKSEYKPIINIENHDTIGMLCMDEKGDIAGSCTTSGLAYKMRGRVGDSPIIGAGLYVDNEVGGAVATGLGESIIKVCGTFLVVELMRQGASPEEACQEAIQRIIKKQAYQDFQVGLLAINKKGEVGAGSIHKGFNYAMHRSEENKMVDSPHYA
ncbi:MAG: N(4)-(beta-N-acetylglucosaminyl)-L-asparaginase [Phaeodactylibacter sp.]|nr:N(4)-(beta-N-acetylglucosaminyl)-L-asparaginase [Phaeodactylibacter sp.]